MQGVAFFEARQTFHANLLESVLTIDKHGIASNADRSSKTSSAIAKAIAEQLNIGSVNERAAGQTSGNRFENICTDFVRSAFSQLAHLRPGNWETIQVGGRNRLEIARYQQYEHLIALDKAAKSDAQLAAALGSDYTITPDIVVARAPEPDEVINAKSALVDDSVSMLSDLRARKNGNSLLHASISCKWTIRSDRAQNSRSEALNLIRNRKGHLPHIMVVTAEPLPSRLASIALGTGDIDCVYHFALYELQAAVKSLGYDDAAELLQIMVEGNRLRDISDLPLDLAI